MVSVCAWAWCLSRLVGMVGVPGTWVAQTLLRPRNLGVLVGRTGLGPQRASSHLHPVVLTSLYLPVDLIVYLIISCLFVPTTLRLPGSRDLVWCDHPCLSLEQRLQHSRLKSDKNECTSGSVSACVVPGYSNSVTHLTQFESLWH